MDIREDILNEMREISPLLADGVRVNPYALPEGYFEDLPGVVLQKITDAPAMLPGVSDAYRIPENYFVSLSDSVLSKIQRTEEGVNEELEAVAPLLNTISKKTVLSLPDGYFEQLQPVIKNEQEEKGKLVNFKTYRRWIQYAAVAMVAGVLVTGAFLFTDSNSYLEQEKKVRMELKALPDTAKDAGVQQPDMNNSAEVAENTPNNEKDGDEAINTVRKAPSLKSTLEMVSDEELKKYLEENTIPEPIFPDNTEIEDSL